MPAKQLRVTEHLLKGAGKAQKELGLNFTDSNGRLLPMADILDKIKGKYKDLSKKSTQDKLVKAFGSDEALKTLLALIDKTGELRDGQKEAQRQYDRWLKNHQEDGKSHEPR